MTRYRRLLGLTAVALTTVFFLLFALRHWRRLPPFELDAAGVGALGIAVVALAAAQGLGAAGWLVLLRGLGEKAGASRVVAVSLISQLAKYLPGNVGHYLGRVGLARSYGFEMSGVVVSLVYEVGLAVVASSSLVLALSIVYGEELAALLPPGGRYWLLALALAAVVLPVVVAAVLRRRLTRRHHGAEGRRPGARALALYLLLGWGTFVLNGLALAVLLGRLSAVPRAPLLLTGIFAATWLPGYLTPGAPGGLGVREAALAAALTPLYGGGVALGATLLLRATGLVAEGAAFVVGLGIRRLAPATPRRGVSHDAADRPR